MQTNPVKAIREKCLDCSGGSSSEVKACPVNGCALHPFRFGKNPYRTPRTLTEEQREAIKERLARSRPYATKGNPTNSPAEGKDTPEQESPAEPITDAENATK